MIYFYRFLRDKKKQQFSFIFLNVNTIICNCLIFNMITSTGTQFFLNSNNFFKKTKCMHLMMSFMLMKHTSKVSRIELHTLFVLENDEWQQKKVEEKTRGTTYILLFIIIK